MDIDPRQWDPPLENRPFILPESAPRVHPGNFKKQEPLKSNLLKILKTPQGRNRDFIYRQYDQRVGTRTVRDSSFPLAVIRLDETKRELAFTTGCRPHLMNVDVREGAKDAVFYPALQLALRGFTPWAVTDCLNFGNPEKSEIMGEFVLSVESIASACEVLDTPVISGNVSFYNESSKGKNITPTPALVMIGLKEKQSPFSHSGFSRAGERVYLLRDHQFCFSGLFAQILKKKTQAFGALQDELSRLFIFRILELAQTVSLTSARVVGKFGLLYTLARMSLEKGIGFFSEKKLSFPFQERLYEIVVSVSSSEEKVFQKQIKSLGLESCFLGETQGTALQVGDMVCSLEEMNRNYNTSWEDLSL